MPFDVQGLAECLKKILQARIALYNEWYTFIPDFGFEIKCIKIFSSVPRMLLSSWTISSEPLKHKIHVSRAECVYNGLYNILRFLQ